MIIGQILNNRYEIQQQLSKNTGRRSLLAQDLHSQELVVIKLLAFNSDFEWDDLKLFEREAETLKNLAHPAIPRYLDYFEVKQPFKGFALVQTYIPALTLAQSLNDGRTFTELEVKQIARSLLEILIYLHEQIPPVIHRDIKPSNILLGDRTGNHVGQVYLIDFGSVQTIAATEGATRTVVGTYGYMSQEQFGGRTVPASDLYSLGATLIYLVTGTHPADLPQKDFRIQFDNFTTSVSLDFTDWLKWLTQPSLEARLSSATLALEALEQPSPKASLSVVKPAGSKIQLTKTSDSLEIIIPRAGLDPSMIVLGVFAIAWNSFILTWTIGALSLAPFPINIPFALFSIPFWTVGGGMAFSVLFTLYRSIRLQINPQQITKTYELFGFKFNHPRPASRQNIDKLVYIPQHLEKDSINDTTTVMSQLIIYAGVQKYSLASNDAGIRNYSFSKKSNCIKSEREVEWLANQLSNWLNLPITGRK